MDQYANQNPNPSPDNLERSDGQIREDILKKFEGNELLRGRGLRVDVADCVVTLSGNVPDPQSWELASSLASYVGGVKQINNQIKVVDQ